MGDYIFLHLGSGLLVLKMLFYKQLLVLWYSLIGLVGTAFHLSLDLYRFVLPGETKIGLEFILGGLVLWLACAGVWEDLTHD